MRSLRFLLARRWILLALTVVLLSYLAYWLGQWQFHRLADRKERNSTTQRNEVADPKPVAARMQTDRGVSPADEWRLLTATGVYRPQQTVVVRYQTRDGVLGVDVVVPLVTSDGVAVLVDRGWFATDQRTPEPSDLPAPPAGEVTVVGWLRGDATGDSAKVTNGSTRAVSSATIGPTLDLPVYRGFLDLKSEDPPPDQALKAAELPDLGNGPHFFYGLQWWFFGLLALGGFGYLTVDEWRRTTGRRPDPGDSGRRVTRTAASRRQPEP